LPYLSQCTVGEIAVVFDLCTAYWFTESGGSFQPQDGAKQTLRFDYGICRFVFADCNGDVWYFTEEGDFDKVLYANARQTSVSQLTPDGQIGSISRTVTQNGKTTTDSNVFEYYSTGENAGKLKSVTFQRSTNPTLGIRRIVYTYYGSGEEHGSLGDLKTATEQLLVGTTWVDHETSYYRYYKAGEANGFEHGLKYALDAQTFARLKRDPQVADPFLATDAQVAKYADNYFEYDGDQRVTKSVTHGGLFTYTFVYQTSAHSDYYNHWKLKVTETRPDGSQLVTYNNYIGQTMLTDLVSGSDHWIKYYQFDGDAHEILHASPSAVVSYDEGQADLGVVLKSSAGLIHRTDYYATTTATPTTPGGAAGYVQFRKLTEGTGGAPIKQTEIKYIQRPAGEVTIYRVAESTRFRHDDGTGAITTKFAYTWFSGTAQIEQKTTTLPVVPTGQNGTGTTDTITEIFDEENNLIWRRDPRGFITFWSYDLPTGALIQQISDVDGAKVTLPSGWSTPAGGGLNLVSDFKHDALGRTVQSLGPSHIVNGQSVRTAAWSVFRDLEDEVLGGQGYALGVGPDYDFVLINPVSIERTSEDGRRRDSIVAARDCAASSPCECLVPDAGAVESPGPLSASDCFPQSSWVRWSQSLYNDHQQLIAQRVYHRIPTCGTGAVGVDFDETLFGYDVMGRRNRTVDPTDTIDRIVFDVRGLAISTWIGTNDNGATDDDPTGGGAPGNNMVQVNGMVYDGGSAGGDGNLTQETEHVDASTTRVTDYEYDFRNRRIVTDGEEDFYEELTYDNLDQVIRTDRRNTTGGGNLVARNEAKFDNRGQVYQTIRFAVNPATGSIGNSLVDNTWHDASGNVICTLPAGSQTFSKTVFDGIGRPTTRYVGYNPSGVITPDSVAGDLIFEQVVSQYDAASNVIFTTARQRWDNATGTGPLQGPSASEPKSRDTYVAMWQDGIGRLIASANFGTNDNAGPPERPESPPESTDEVLVSLTAYNERGEAFETTDPAGMVNRTYADDAGRTVRTIQNFVAASDPACFCPGAELNVVTEMVHGPGSLLKELVAVNLDTGNQVTRYEHGVVQGESDVASGRLLRGEVYPDAADSTDRVTFAWNRLQQRKAMRDQNGSVHEYVFDGLGRQTGDAVTTLAAGVDGAVRRIGQTYEVRGMVAKITSYSDTAGTTPVNEVHNGYNSFAQLAEQYQEHAGAVNTGTTPKVAYGYADGSANTIRPTSMTYSNGRVLDYLYDDTHADKLSRVRTLRWDGVDVCRYAYLGLNSFVTVQYPEPGIEYNLATGAGANRYAGLDRYGRITELLWQRTDVSSSSSSSSSGSGPGNALVHLKYGYDRASNRTYRKDIVAKSYGKDFDELYEYDGLHRLKKFHRGRLVDNNTAIESPTLQQGWQLDATGNWRNFTQNDQADADQTLDQQRLHNRVNEITQIARTVGENWATPEYDRNGNMTVIPQPKDMTAVYQGTWDAWNRLVKLDDGPTSVQANRYDGLNRRVSQATSEEDRDYFYSNAWQVLEEGSVGASSSTSSSSSGSNPSVADRQFVWGARYIDDLVLRDRSVGGTTYARLYGMQDANWNVVSVSDMHGSVAIRFVYDAYGVDRVLGNMYSPLTSPIEWVYRYAGRRLDLSTSLYHNRRRDYSSFIGMFLKRDPISYIDDNNLYSYVHDAPTRYVDPMGMRAICCGFETGLVISEQFAKEIDCAVGTAAEDCCKAFGGQWYRGWRFKRAFDGPCWRVKSNTGEAALATAAVAGVIAIPSDPSDVVGTPAGLIVAGGALVVYACAASHVLVLPNVDIILSNISQNVASLKSDIEAAFRSSAGDAAREASRSGPCLFYYAWCLWANGRPPGDPGRGWRRSAPCESCFAACVETGTWPMSTCPMDGPRGPRWLDGESVPPTFGQY
jgi:RHS repeat-associated protein